MEINGGAEYINQPSVTLAIRPPTETSALTFADLQPLDASSQTFSPIERSTIDIYQIQVSNHPHFSPASLLPLSLTITWTLEQEGPSGPRTVYVRFIDSDGRHSVTYEDSILLDEQPPTGSISIQPQSEGMVLLHLDAHDDLSGVDQMQLIQGDEPQPDGWIHYQNTYALPLGEAVSLQVRYRDSAGNVSDMYRGVHPAHLTQQTYIPLALGTFGQ